MAKNVRVNPVTGESDYYFPMEITTPSIKEAAKANGLEVGKARLGFREFTAVFVPCKKTAFDALGHEVFLDTPSDEQYNIYKSLCHDELNAQDVLKQDGRCNIPDDKGGYKRCPLRVQNPDYLPDNGQPKTIAVKCAGCKYEPFRQEHTFIELSCLDHKNDDGDIENYEVPTPEVYCTAESYLKLRDGFINFVSARNAKLVPLAQLLSCELKKSEAARKLNLATSTVGSRNDKLKELLLEFLDNTISF